MTRFFVRRLLQSIGLLIVVITAIFFLLRMTPGGPEAALTQNPRLGPDQQEQLRERFGLNDPLPVQYAKWVLSVAHLDFGRSYAYTRPAMDVVWERLWPTIQLGLMSFVIALLGIPLGLYAALHRGRAGDMVVRVFTTIGHSLPSWWLGLSAIVLLSSLVGWFPNGQGQGSPVEWLKYIILPAAVLGLATIVSFTRFTRSEVIEVLTQDYVRTARAKGLMEGMVVSRHVLRNAMLPLVTLIGLILPSVLSGAVITEVVFSWPGVGRLFYESAGSRDYPVLMAILTITTFATILGTFVTDLAYGFLDPRVRYP